MKSRQPSSGKLTRSWRVNNAGRLIQKKKMKRESYFSRCRSLAKGILDDRVQRRSMVTQLLIIVLILVALGNWVITDWLSDGVIRFVVFWGLVTLLVLFILLMAVYDLLKVMRDE